MKDWNVVYKSTILTRVEIVKGVLNDRGIDAISIDKKDSSLHIPHGQIEIMVKQSDVLSAIKIINDEITFK